ncbi:hypothetical protein PLESTF_001595300 [Pleodorina starrii]|nr:hypothetical protein PLESTF_001595300 [Pleodorina starrii]
MTLHSCRALLPDAASDPRSASLLAACRPELTTRGSFAAAAAAAMGPAPVAAPPVEVLVWLFPDAPSRHLPPQLLGALLASDAFGTDDEASVLLLLLLLLLRWLCG